MARFVGFAGGAFILGPEEGGEPDDTTPDAFSFTDQFNVPTTTTRTSNAITVSGINVATPISVSGAASAEYSINGGAFTADPGTVVNGDSVRARHTSSGSASTQVDTVVDIGGVTDTFSSTTAGAGGTASIAPITAAMRRRRLLLS